MSPTTTTNNQFNGSELINAIFVAEVHLGLIWDYFPGGHLKKMSK